MPITNESIEEFKQEIIAAIGGLEVVDTDMFGPHYQYTIPLFCGENNFICLHNPSYTLYMIFNSNWSKV